MKLTCHVISPMMQFNRKTKLLDVIQFRRLFCKLVKFKGEIHDPFIFRRRICNLLKILDYHESRTL